jgi:universal stress protein A
MGLYSHILLGLDLSEDSDLVAAKGANLAKQNNASLSVVHVIEPLSFAYGGDIPMDFSSVQEEIYKQAENQMRKLGAKWDIPEERQHIVIGRPESEIHTLAYDLGADLVLVGSHGRHGLALVFGSTANGVLHGANCDVLAVRV